MGINGLLPLLKSIHRPCSLKKFAGKTLAVDAYGWLHRGTIACAVELAMDKPTKKFVDFAMHRVRMLQHFGVIPYLVFDGDYLPSKAATEEDRRKRREESKKIGLELLNAGKSSQAHLELQKAIDVTPEMARQLIDELKKAGVQYVVAPYEADAQMVYLERKGLIQGILSEDSDLLVFGAKCLLTKLDQYGNCIEVNKADFRSCREITLTGWSDKEFRQMAILSGCDYLSSISKMGLKTAYRMMRKHKTIEKVVRMLQFDGKYHVPKGYLEEFYKAELTFLHQRVFCPQLNKLVYHTEPEQPLEDSQMLFIGAHVEANLAKGVATGDLNPMTKRPILAIESRRATTGDIPRMGVPFGEFFKAQHGATGQSPRSRTTIESSLKAQWKTLEASSSSISTTKASLKADRTISERGTLNLGTTETQLIMEGKSVGVSPKRSGTIGGSMKQKRAPLGQLDQNCIPVTRAVLCHEDKTETPKKRASIDSYFSRKREPLGELELNSVPTKRARLCLEETIAATSRSRFFG